jgi:hypothetical protein
MGRLREPDVHLAKHLFAIVRLRRSAIVGVGRVSLIVDLLAGRARVARARV